MTYVFLIYAVIVLFMTILNCIVFRLQPKLFSSRWQNWFCIIFAAFLNAIIWPIGISWLWRDYVDFFSRQK